MATNSSVPRLLESELFRLNRRMMTRVTLALLAAIVIAAYVLLWSTSGSLDETALAELKDHLRLTNAPKYGMDIAYQMGMLISVVVAASTMAKVAWIRRRIIRSP